MTIKTAIYSYLPKTLITGLVIGSLSFAVANAQTYQNGGSYGQNGFNQQSSYYGGESYTNGNYGGYGGYNGYNNGGYTGGYYNGGYNGGYGNYPGYQYSYRTPVYPYPTYQYQSYFYPPYTNNYNYGNYGNYGGYGNYGYSNGYYGSGYQYQYGY